MLLLCMDCLGWRADEFRRPHAVVCFVPPPLEAWYHWAAIVRYRKPSAVQVGTECQVNPKHFIRRQDTLPPILARSSVHYPPSGLKISKQCKQECLLWTQYLAEKGGGTSDCPQLWISRVMSREHNRHQLTFFTHLWRIIRSGTLLSPHHTARKSNTRGL